MVAFDGQLSPEYDPTAKRRPWSTDEDEHLKQPVGEHGIKSWAAIATRLRDRNGKQCGKGGATICDRSCSRASGRRKKTRRSGIVYKRWERSGPRFRNSTCPAAQTMTSRTGGTRSSGRRMPQEAASLKTRCEHCFLVAPHARSPARNSAGLTGADFGPVEKRKHLKAAKAIARVALASRPWPRTV